MKNNAQFLLKAKRLHKGIFILLFSYSLILFPLFAEQLPTILSETDAETYGQIFGLQDKGKFPAAKKLESKLLIVHRHKSWMNIHAIWILHLFNIELLVLPGHSTHVLQPFDRAVASPLKTTLKEALT
jgi:hypothetical protein